MKIGIIGGGAAGLACAIEAARRAKKLNKNVSVRILESKDRVGKKLLATGNGRCNMLNADRSPLYFSNNGFHRFAIKKFDYESNLEFFASMGLYTRCDEEGRVYPLSNQASSVLDCLRNECCYLGIQISTDFTVEDIKKTSDGFIVNGNEYFDKIVLACGGKALVKGFNGYDLLNRLGHKTTKIYPSLSKLNTVDTSDVKQLQGIRHKADLTLKSCGRLIAEEKGEILFAKYGISGIAVMQLSAYVTRVPGAEFTVEADFIPDMSCKSAAECIYKIINHNPELKCESLLEGFMPKKLGEVIVKSVGLSISEKCSLLSSDDIKQIVEKAKHYCFRIDSVRGFEDAQVTAGGADTEYFNPQTMESKLLPGLFCIGELLDVDGLCGGYNLMWAWSSGRLCGESLVK